MKSQHWTLVGIAVVCLGLMILVVPRFSDQTLVLPLWLLVIGEWLFTFLLSLVSQLKEIRKSSVNLRIEPACLALSLIFFSGATAIIFSPLAQLGNNWTVSISTGQFLVMNIGIIVLIIASEYIHGRKLNEKVSKAQELQRVTNTRVKKHSFAKTTATKMTTVLQKLVNAGGSKLDAPSKTDSAPANKASQQLISAANDTSLKKAIIDEQAPEETRFKGNVNPNELRAELRRLPSVHSNKPANKIVDPNKPQSSTITKLQALSASGVGSVHQVLPPEADRLTNVASNSETGLKSVLDRLDDSEQEQPTITEQTQMISQQPLNSSISQQNNSTATSTANRGSLFSQPVDKEMDDLFSEIASPEAQKDIQQLDKNTIGAMPANAGFVDFQAPPPARTLPSDLPLKNTPSTNEPKLFRGKVDDQVEALFSDIAPSAAQKEVHHSVSDRNQLEQPSSPEITLRSYAGSVRSTSDLTQKDFPAAELPSSEPKLFRGSVDDRVEALFSDIAPSQAQEGVNDFNRGQLEDQQFSTKSYATEAPVPQSLVPQSSVPKVSVPKGLTEQSISPASKEPVDSEALALQNTIAQELKDFGRLSTKAATSSTSPVGTMKTIGKLLIDSNAVDNIIKKAESGTITVNLPSAKVISAVHGEGIQSLLSTIDTCKGVAGSMLVGGDGLVIASTYEGSADRDTIGVLANGMLGNSNLAMLRLDLGKLEQMILVTNYVENNKPNRVTTVLTDVEVGALAVFIDSPLAIALDQLLEQLVTIARG